MTTRLRTSLALLALGLLACVGPPRTASEAPAPRAGRLLVAPLNLAVHCPSELRESAPAVWDALIAYLRTQDRQVAVLHPSDAERLWREGVVELQRSGGGVELASAEAHFARRLAEHADYDLLVLPSLVLRRARVAGRGASWDGVRRPLVMRPDPRDGTRLDVGSLDIRFSGYTGSLSAASLHVALLDPAGGLAYEGLGGLALVQEVEPPGDRAGETWSLRPRPLPFADAEDLAHGVRQTFERRLPRTAWAR